MATEVQLTRLSDVGPGEMSTALWGHRGATASKFLSAEQLAVLGARAAGSAARRPLTSLPAVGVGGAEGRMGGKVWGCQAGTLREEEAYFTLGVCGSGWQRGCQCSLAV